MSLTNFLRTVKASHYQVSPLNSSYLTQICYYFYFIKQRIYHQQQNLYVFWALKVADDDSGFNTLKRRQDAELMNWPSFEWQTVCYFTF